MRFPRSFKMRAPAALTFLCAALVGNLAAADDPTKIGAAPVQYSILHSFTGKDGYSPYGALIQGSDGNFYGTTFYGGKGSGGTAYKMTPSGQITTLHAFNCCTADGDGPSAALTQASDGNLYGVTFVGGTYGGGTAFKITPAGKTTILHSFGGNADDGAGPYLAPLIQANDGNFYGTNGQGAINNFGTVYKMTPTGDVTVLHRFSGPPSDGATPWAPLLQTADGNFYGTTYLGGTYNSGTVFKMSPDGSIVWMYSFSSDNYAAKGPLGGLIQGSDGDLYGTTAGGAAPGSPNESGTVFKISTDGQITILAIFPYDPNSGKYGGFFPQAGLVQGRDGNFYGTTYEGGIYGGGLGVGTLYRMTPQGSLTVIHSFGGTAKDGSLPITAVMQSRDGSIYGTTTDGGKFSYGTVFKAVVP